MNGKEEPLMAKYIVMTIGTATTKSLSHRKQAPPPQVTVDLTAGPWYPNIDPATNLLKYADYPAIGRYTETELDDLGSGSEYTLKVTIKKDGPAQLDCVVFHKATQRVVCKVRPRLKEAGVLIREKEFVV
jgi:hypothetical protein